MNNALKAAVSNPQNHFINLRAALFHSTPVLERKRRSHWHTPVSLFVIFSAFSMWVSFILFMSPSLIDIGSLLNFSFTFLRY